MTSNIAHALSLALELEAVLQRIDREQESVQSIITLGVARQLRIDIEIMAEQARGRK